MKSTNFEKILKSQEKNLDKEQKDRIERCVPIARKVLKVLASHFETMPLGEVDQSHEGFKQPSLDVIQVLLENNVNWSDRDVILQIALQAFQFPQNMISNSLNRSWENTLTGLFGKRFSELTFEDVDKCLKKADELTGENKT